MKRRLPLLVRVSFVAVLIIVVVLSAAIALTDPDPASLLTRKRLGTLIGLEMPEITPTARVIPPPPPAPLFSDEWFDDSGYSFITNFNGPIDDPTSLDQLRASIQDRGKRGIAQLTQKLDEFDPKDPRTPGMKARLHWVIGGLCMYEGDFRAAEAHFQQARDLDPNSPDDYQANMEALIGVASLRRGEVENCVACCNEDSCIFPFAPDAIHLQTEGSRNAIDHFTRYLEKRPQDLGVRWLLNLAAMTLGEHPRAVPARFRLPLETVHSSRQVARFTNVASRVGLGDRGANMAGGSIFDDFNNDGLDDLFLSTSDPSRGAALYLNQGDGTFQDLASPGLEEQTAALNCVHADYDNDGRLDVLLLRGGWEGARRMSLLRNRSDGSFQDVTLASGLAQPIGTQAAAWSDYDNDGHLDLYVAGEYDLSRPDLQNLSRLYHNKGDGTFEDVSRQMRVTNQSYGKGVAWGDYDADGDPDLYVANLGQPNRLYRNDANQFTDVATTLGLAEPIYAFACWFWDFDNDGHLDLYVNAYGATLSDVVRSHLGQPTSGERPRLYRNQGDGTFRNVAIEAGLDRVLMPMGCNFGDIDNDGYLDIYLGTGKPSYTYLTPNVMFRNDQGKRFDDVTGSSGTGHLQKGHGVSFADYDHDGDVDLFIEAGGATPGDQAHNILFQNPRHEPKNHWLNLRLTGKITNRSAIGAAVKLTLVMPDGTKEQRHRTIGNNSSFGGNTLAPTIGLGQAQAIEELEIHWPTSNLKQLFQNIPLDTALTLTEGADTYQKHDWTPISSP